MKEPWLIQRGTIKDIPMDEITGINSLVHLDYMGSAEFEFGVLPKSLRNIMKNNKDYAFREMTVNSLDGKQKSIFLYAKKEDMDEIPAWIKLFSENQFNETKESVGLYDALNPKEWLASIYATRNFWWDIQNNWFAFFGVDNQKKVETAILKNIERNVPDMSKE